MIERYALYETQNLSKRFLLPHGVPRGVKQKYNISPTQPAPVVVLRNGERVMEVMRWGFVPQGAKDMNSVFRYKTFSVRSEDVFKKATWDKAIRTQRCVIPANGFYMWQQYDDDKQPYYVQGKDSLMALAGVYGSWTNPDGETRGIFAFVTVPSTSDLPGHKTRSPVLLDTDAKVADWLNPEYTDATSLFDLMRTPDEQTLFVKRVGKEVNSAKSDDPRLIVEQ